MNSKLVIEMEFTWNLIKFPQLTMVKWTASWRIDEHIVCSKLPDTGSFPKCEPSAGFDPFPRFKR